MSDTPPAETGSGADPAEDPATLSGFSGVSSEPHPPESASTEPTPRPAAVESGDAPAESPSGAARAEASGGMTFSTLSRYPGSGAGEAALPASSVARTPWSPTQDGAAEHDAFGQEPPSEPPASSVWPWGMHGLIETIEVLALALLMFLLVRSVAQNFVVDGGSMEPTFHNGEMLIVNKLAYKNFNLSWLPFTDKDDWRPFGAPQSGDVVVFKFPQDQNRDFIKRVIAIPGQTVEVRGGKVYLDGIQQNEPYLDQAPTYDYGPVTVPKGQLFVLGDNRNNSYDSHSWGLLDQSLLIGRAEFRYWPFGRIGRIDHGGLSAEAGVTITQGASSSSSTAR